ncbi:MAG: hypothetical protein AAB262_08885 [Elusimicrobiota bacterium]
MIPFLDPSRIWLGGGYTTYSMPQICRVVIGFHEARHTEVANNFWRHALCPTPFKDENGQDVRSLVSGLLMAGQDACDESPIGSYGVEAILFKNIEKHCSSCSGKVRMDAGLYGDDVYKRIVGTAAVKALRGDLYQ